MATYGFCENKCKYEVYTKGEVDTKLTEYKLQGDFVILTGEMEKSTSHTELWVKEISYPTGYTQNNSVVVSVMVKGTTSATDVWTNGSLFNSSNTLAGAIPTSIRLKTDNIEISSRNIAINGDTMPAVGEASGELNYKIVLMKI